MMTHLRHGVLACWQRFARRVCASRLSCREAGKASIFPPAREASGKSRHKPTREDVMTRWATLAIALFLSAFAAVQYTNTASGQAGGDGWITLFDGKNLDAWDATATPE